MTLSAPKAPLFSPEQDMMRLKRMSRLLSLFCLVLIVVLPPLFAWFWAVATPAQLAARINLPADAVQGPLMLWQRVAGGCVSAVPLALLLAGLWQARKCLAVFAGGHIFTLQAATALRQFASFATASFASSFLASTVLSTLLTFNNAPGGRQISVGISTDQALALFFAGMVWLMAAEPETLPPPVRMTAPPALPAIRIHICAGRISYAMVVESNGRNPTLRESIRQMAYRAVTMCIFIADWTTDYDCAVPMHRSVGGVTPAKKRTLPVLKINGVAINLRTNIIS